MTQTILFVFYSQQLLRTGHRSVIKKNPALGERDHEIGACSLGRCRRNPAENEHSIDCIILKYHLLSYVGTVRKRSLARVLHASAGVADLLGLNPCKTQSRNQIAVIEYVTGFERVAEDLRRIYRICVGFKN
jgi:hypothetical protein